MNFTLTRTVKFSAYLLIALVITQALYTVLYINKVDVPRGIIWGLEGFLFPMLAAFAGAALVQAKANHLGWSAIAFSAVFNLIQVSIGLTMFGPFYEAAGQAEAITPAAGAVVAFSFMVYNAAKILLSLAAVIFGLSQMQSGGKALGGLTTLVGAVALLANTILIVFGRDAFLPSAVGGGAGAVATLLLALCLIASARED